MSKPNLLKDIFDAKRIVSCFTTASNLERFPELSKSQLVLISLGTYQVRMAISYYFHTIKERPLSIKQFTRRLNYSEFGISVECPWLIRASIRSRYRSGKTYRVYILCDLSLNGPSTIKEYYCTCIVGSRTAGCCSHVMTLIWHLGWGRYYRGHQEPASMLNAFTARIA